jgi:hypothetical protein
LVGHWADRLEHLKEVKKAVNWVLKLVQQTVEKKDDETAVMTVRQLVDQWERRKAVKRKEQQWAE